MRRLRNNEILQNKTLPGSHSLHRLNKIACLAGGNWLLSIIVSNSTSQQYVVPKALVQLCTVRCYLVYHTTTILLTVLLKYMPCVYSHYVLKSRQYKNYSTNPKPCIKYVPSSSYHAVAVLLPASVLFCATSVGGWGRELLKRHASWKFAAIPTALLVEKRPSTPLYPIMAIPTAFPENERSGR